MEWTRSRNVSGNVKPGVDPERSDYRTLRVERGTCFNPLQALITSPHQTECTSSFLHLRPIQAEIKTFMTLFEKCKRIYGLKIMKSEFKKAGTLQLRESVVSTENFSLWETRELMQRTVDICGGRCGYCGWLLSLHILLVLQFRNFHA